MTVRIARSRESEAVTNSVALKFRRFLNMCEGSAFDLLALVGWFVRCLLNVVCRWLRYDCCSSNACFVLCLWMLVVCYLLFGVPCELLVVV